MDKACFWGDACKDAEPVVIVRLGTITTFHFSDGNAPSKPFLHMDFGPIQCLKLARNNIIKHRGQQAASKGLLTPQPPLYITCCILVGTLVVMLYTICEVRQGTRSRKVWNIKELRSCLDFGILGSFNLHPKYQFCSFSLEFGFA